MKFALVKAVLINCSDFFDKNFTGVCGPHNSELATGIAPPKDPTQLTAATDHAIGGSRDLGFEIKAI